MCFFVSKKLLNEYFKKNNYTIKNYKIKNLNVGSFFTLSSRPFGLRLIFWVSPIFLESLTTLKDHIENFQQKWGAHFLCKQTGNTVSNIYRLSKTSLTYTRKASPVESPRFWKKLIIWYYYYKFFFFKTHWEKEEHNIFLSFYRRETEGFRDLVKLMPTVEKTSALWSHSFKTEIELW